MAEREQLQQKQTSAGSYRFPPTASVATNYSHIVPNRNKRGTSVRALERALEKREEEEGDQGRFPIIIPPASMSASPFISTLHDHASHETWSQRSSALLSTLTSQISALQRSIHLKERHLEEVLPLVQTLAAAARESPAHTAHALASRGLHAPHLRSHTQRPVLACAGAGADGRACRRRVLPFSRYCLKHIHRDSDQVLFGSCSAVDADAHAPCRQPVFDILLTDPLCLKHVTPKALSNGAVKPQPTGVRKRAAQGGGGGGRSKRARASGQRSKKKGRGAKASPKTAPECPSATPTAAPRAQVGVSSLSSSSWSSGSESEGGEGHGRRQHSSKPAAAAAGAAEPDAKAPTASPVNLLPTLPSVAPTFPPPALTSLNLLPPLPTELDKFMEDSSSSDEDL